MVIKVSKQLLADLEISDVVGMTLALFQKQLFFFFLNFMGRRQERREALLVLSSYVRK